MLSDLFCTWTQKSCTSLSIVTKCTRKRVLWVFALKQSIFCFLTFKNVLRKNCVLCVPSKSKMFVLCSSRLKCVRGLKCLQRSFLNLKVHDRGRGLPHSKRFCDNSKLKYSSLDHDYLINLLRWASCWQMRPCVDIKPVDTFSVYWKCNIRPDELY